MGDEIEHRAIAIGIVGPGLVGKALIAQLAEQVKQTQNCSPSVKEGSLRGMRPLMTGPYRSCCAG